jgi:hypothetical protein
MMEICGTITTEHRNPACIARALQVDNLSCMATRPAGGHVVTDVAGDQLRSIIASVDDYLMNLAIAEDVCQYGSH